MSDSKRLDLASSPQVPDSVGASDYAALIGYTSDGQPVWLDYEARKTHLEVFGVSGTGKSTEKVHLALADIHHPDRHGVCVVDPHGPLVQSILERVPEHRLDDVILIDLSDLEYPVAFNLFAPVPDPSELDFYSSALESVFEMTFGARWEPVSDALRNMTVMLLSRTGAHVAVSDSPSEMLPAMDELPQLLHLEPPAPGEESKHWTKQLKLSYRSHFYEGLAKAGLMPIIDYWTGIYDPMTFRPKSDLKKMVGERINRFLTNPSMAATLGQAQNKLDLDDALAKGKIILVNLPKSKLGTENAKFFGSVFLARLMVAIFKRGADPQADLKPFHVYVDEAQDFTTAALPTLLAEGRKFGVDLVLSSQKKFDVKTPLGNAASPTNLFCFEVRGGDQLDLAWEFDTTPPEPPPDYRPIYDPVYHIEHQHALPKLPVPRLEEIEMPPCPIEIEWLDHYLEHSPVFRGDLDMAINSSEFGALDSALSRNLRVLANTQWADDVRRYISAMDDRVLPEGKVVYVNGESTWIPFVPDPMLSFQKSLSDGSRYGRFSEGQRPPSTWHVRPPDPPQLSESVAPALQLLPTFLGDKFRRAIAQHVASRNEWFAERERRWTAKRLEVEEFNAFIRDADDRPVRQYLSHYSRRSSTRSWGGSSSDSRSSRSLDGDITYGRSSTQSWGATEDTGEYEQVPGRARPRSDMHLEIANQLAHLGQHRMMVRLKNEPPTERNRIVNTVDLPPPTLTDEQLESIIKRSRRDHCRPRAEVEVELRERYAARVRSVGLAWSFGEPLPEAPTYEADEEDD